MHVTGCIRPNQFTDRECIERFMPSKKDQRSFHLKLVLVLVMTLSPHSLATSEYLKICLYLIASSCPPANNTVNHVSSELYSCVFQALRHKLQREKKHYSCLPCSHFVTDLWSEDQKNTSFGSIFFRHLDPETREMEVAQFGMSLILSRNVHPTIKLWFLGRLEVFGVLESDFESTMTDSGASLRAAMLRVRPPWLSCMAHSMHNAVSNALGATTCRVMGKGRRDADVIVPSPTRRSKNAPQKALVSKILKLNVHFFNSERIVALCSKFILPPTGPCRQLVEDVPTHWS